jgi:hypothetical protein
MLLREVLTAYARPKNHPYPAGQGGNANGGCLSQNRQRLEAVTFEQRYDEPPSGRGGLGPNHSRFGRRRR